METTMKLKKQSEELRMDWYEAEISLSEADKDSALKNLPTLMKQLLEKQGHKVRKIEVSSEFEKLARAAVTKGGTRDLVVLPACGCAHIVYPPAEKSLWIVINLAK